MGLLFLLIKHKLTENGMNFREFTRGNTWLILVTYSFSFSIFSKWIALAIFFTIKKFFWHNFCKVEFIFNNCFILINPVSIVKFRLQPLNLPCVTSQELVDIMIPQHRFIWCMTAWSSYTQQYKCDMCVA